MEEKQGRWSSQKKADVVLRLLRGESIDAVGRECAVTVETLTRWREDFVAGGIAGPKGKTLDQVRIAALEKKIGQQAMELELHGKKTSSCGREAIVRPAEAPGESLPRAIGSEGGWSVVGSVVYEKSDEAREETPRP